MIFFRNTLNIPFSKMSTDIQNTTISSTNTTTSTNLTKECNICLLAVDPRHATLTHCGHYYHKNCLCSWFNSRIHLPANCPTCRADLKYERGVVEYYSGNTADMGQLRRVKLIQNTDGDYFFYPDRNQKYFLKIDRKNNIIKGGSLYNRTNTEGKMITPQMLERHREKFERLLLDEDYEIFGEV